MASFVYNSFWEDLARGNIDLDTNTFRVMLVTDAYVPDKDAHVKRDSITNEITATGYTAKGPTVTFTITKDTATDRISYTMSSISLPTFTGTSRRAIYYRDRGGASSADELIACNDFGANVTYTAATMSIAAFNIRVQN